MAKLDRKGQLDHLNNIRFKQFPDIFPLVRFVASPCVSWYFGKLVYASVFFYAINKYVCC